MHSRTKLRLSCANLSVVTDKIKDRHIYIQRDRTYRLSLHAWNWSNYNKCVKYINVSVKSEFDSQDRYFMMNMWEAVLSNIVIYKILVKNPCVKSSTKKFTKCSSEHLEESLEQKLAGKFLAKTWKKLIAKSYCSCKHLQESF